MGRTHLPTHHWRKPARSSDWLTCHLFFGTGIPAAILIFNIARTKQPDTEGIRRVLFIDASKGYDSAKNQNRLNESHINHIVDTYRKFNKGELLAGVAEDKFSYVATFEEIQENDFNLNIPHYVDTFEEEAEVDIAGVQQEIVRLEGELEKVQSEMKKYLDELIPWSWSRAAY